MYKRTLNQYNDPTILKKYRQHRRILQQIKRKAKVSYYRNKCKDFKNDTRKLWSIINTITGKTKRKETVINELKINNIKTRNSKKMDFVTILPMLEKNLQVEYLQENMTLNIT